MHFIKQSTIFVFKLGPFISESDGITLDTLNDGINNTNILLSKNGNSFAAKNYVETCDHDSNGFYTCTLDTTDTNNHGSLKVSCKVFGDLSVYHEFTVLNAAVYDSLFTNAGTLKAVDDTANTKLDTIVSDLPSVGPIASQGDVQNLCNNTKIRISVPDDIVIPDSGNTIFPLFVYFYDSLGNPTDPDNNEIAVQARAINQQVYRVSWTNDEAGTLGATISTTFTPSYYKMVREAEGIYKLYYPLPSTENPDIWQLNIRLEETSITIPASKNITISESVSTIVLEDTDANKIVISKALKNYDSSLITAVGDSIYSDLKDPVDTIVSKLPSGSISDLSLNDTIDGVTFSTILEKIMSMYDGKFVSTTSDGVTTITFYKRNNSTQLAKVQVTTSGRERV